MADEKEPDQPKEPASGLDAAAERVRTTAKWMVVTFGGVAAALLVGVQLSSLKDATGDARHDATVGYALGIAGVLLVIVAAAVTLTAGRVALHSLRRKWPWLLYWRLNRMDDLRPGFASIAELVTAVEAANSDHVTKWLTWHASRTTEDEAASVAAREKSAQLVPLSNRLLKVASYEQLRQTWAVCLLLIVLGAGAAAYGMALFATNVKKADENEPAVAMAPVAGVLELTPTGLRVHRAELGAACKREGIAVIATAADTKEYELTVVPTAQNPCGPAEITLASRHGSVVASETVELP